MSINSLPESPILVIKENICLTIDRYQLEIESYLGCFTPGIHSFQVKISDRDADLVDERSALLRLGGIQSGLERELRLRNILGDYGLIAKLVTQEQLGSNSVKLELPSQTIESTPALELDEPKDSGMNISSDSASGEPLTSRDSEEWESYDRAEKLESSVNIDLTLEKAAEQINDNDGEAIRSPINVFKELRELEDNQEVITNQTTKLDRDEEFLDDEFFPEKVAGFDSSQPQIILVTDFPAESDSLQQWLEGAHSHGEALSVAIQICQCCSFLNRKGWTLVNLTPRFIGFNSRLKIYDLTHVYPLGEAPAVGLIEEYYAPELASSSPIDETMSTYMVGALIYQILHHQLPSLNLSIQTIPGLYQLLKISLSALPDRRFSLSQFQQLLIEARQEMEKNKVRWCTASSSTVGLSLDRLQNEDNFAFEQQQLGDRQTLIIGAVADGMGGMAQGEVASQIAIETVLEYPIPRELSSPEQRKTWLLDLFAKANQSIANAVQNGGTTLSVIMAVDRVLTIGHVGDSRIYWLRGGKLTQLSQDHSYVGVLVSNGEIDEEEAESHPDRNVLVKSLGSNTRLNNGYVQTLEDTIDRHSINLEDRDILLLCSDGVWDLVRKPELTEIFSSSEDLQASVDSTIQKVIDRGAADNATILALQICLN